MRAPATNRLRRIPVFPLSNIPVFCELQPVRSYCWVQTWLRRTMTRSAVAFFVFNRVEVTRVTFQRIAEAKPARLLLIADGPRAGNSADIERCGEVRALLESQKIDWPCDVSTNFSPTNLGCRDRFISGLNWIFSLVNEAIILEDDCLIDPTFFPFCDELLERYRDDSRVGAISANSPLAGLAKIPTSYYFSKACHIWGWATWRRAWSLYDPQMSGWPAVRRNGVLRKILSNPRAVARTTEIFQDVYDGTGPTTWDYPWFYTVLVNRLLCVTPAVNMVRNIGFGAGATNTTDTTSAEANLTVSAMPFPLDHPPAVTNDCGLDDIEDRIIDSRVSLKQKIRACLPKQAKMLYKQWRKLSLRRMPRYADLFH